MRPRACELRLITVSGAPLRRRVSPLGFWGERALRLERRSLARGRLAGPSFPSGPGGWGAGRGAGDNSITRRRGGGGMGRGLGTGRVFTAQMPRQFSCLFPGSFSAQVPKFVAFGIAGSYCLGSHPTPCLLEKKSRFFI